MATVKRYALLGLIVAAGLILYATRLRHAVAAPAAQAGNDQSHETEKTSRRPSVLRCNGYDIVLREQDFVRVQMHEPSIIESLPVEKQFEKQSGISELKNDLWTGGGDVGFESQIYSSSPMIDPRTVREARERRDPSSSLDWKSAFRDDILGEENLPSWGWLAEGIFAEEEAAKKAGESKRAPDMSTLWGRDSWKNDGVSLFGTRTPADRSEEPFGGLFETGEEQSQRWGNQDQKRLWVFGADKLYKDTSEGSGLKREKKWYQQEKGKRRKSAFGY